MNEYDFRLILSGVTALNDDVENAIYEAGCDDATLSLCDGLCRLDFTRDAATLKEAILSAIADVQKTPLRVIRVESDIYQTIADINAELLEA